MAFLPTAGEKPQPDILGRPIVFYAILLGAILLGYGYKLFSFSLGIDEESNALVGNMVHPWLSQGRWGMALLNGLILPQPVMPVVPTALALAGIAGGLYLFLCQITSRSLALLGGLAVGLVFPTLPFTLAFTILSYGVGAGALCVGFFAVHGPRQSLKSSLLAILAGALAISIYQPFVACLAIATILIVLHAAIRTDNALAACRLGIRLVICAVVGLTLYLALDWLIRLLTHTPKTYLQDQLVLDDLLKNPRQRLGVSWHRVVEVLTICSRIFGASAPLANVVLDGSALWLLFLAVARGSLFTRLLKVLCLLAPLVILTLLDALMVVAMPLRSMIYVSFLIAGIVGLAVEMAPQRGRLLIATLLCLAVLSEATVTNRLFLTAQLTYDQDKNLAQQIVTRIEMQPGLDLQAQPLNLIASGAWHEQPTILTSPHGAPDDALGASFFNWDLGNRGRMASILNLYGLPNLNGSYYTLLARKAPFPAMLQALAAMPNWPAEGSVRVFDHDTILLKFGDFSIPQLIDLCDIDLKTYCPAGYVSPVSH